MDKNFDDDYELDDNYEKDDDLDGFEIYDDLEDAYFDYDEDEEYGYEDEEFREVVLTLEDGSELRALVLLQYEVSNQDYIALLPLNDDDTPGEILLYRAEYSDDGETFDIELIEDEDEFEEATEAYYENLDFDEEELLDMLEANYDQHICEYDCDHDDDENYFDDENY